MPPQVQSPHTVSVQIPLQVMSKGHVVQLFSPEPADIGGVIASHSIVGAIAGHYMGQKIMNVKDLVWAVRKIERPHLALDSDP